MVTNTDIPNIKIHIYFFISYWFSYDIKTRPLAPGHIPPLKVGAHPRFETMETEKAIFQLFSVVSVPLNMEFMLMDTVGRSWTDPQHAI